MVYLLFFFRLEQVSALLMMTEALLRTKMMLAEICTGLLSCSATDSHFFEVFVLYLHLTYPFLFLFKSALTQFFQLFPEYQSNEFYATGEVSFSFNLFTLKPLN